jgi:hypothetical protein
MASGEVVSEPYFISYFDEAGDPSESIAYLTI